MLLRVAISISRSYGGLSRATSPKEEKVPLDIVPVSPAMFLGVPFTYQISFGVRKGDNSRKNELNRVLDSESNSIQQILSQYGVPQIHEGG